MKIAIILLLTLTSLFEIHSPLYATDGNKKHYLLPQKKIIPSFTIKKALYFTCNTLLMCIVTLDKNREGMKNFIHSRTCDGPDEANENSLISLTYNTLRTLSHQPSIAWTEFNCGIPTGLYNYSTHTNASNISFLPPFCYDDQDCISYAKVLRQHALQTIDTQSTISEKKIVDSDNVTLYSDTSLSILKLLQYSGTKNIKKMIYEEICQNHVSEQFIKLQLSNIAWDVTRKSNPQESTHLLTAFHQNHLVGFVIFSQTSLKEGHDKINLDLICSSKPGTGKKLLEKMETTPFINPIQKEEQKQEQTEYERLIKLKSITVDNTLKFYENNGYISEIPRPFDETWSIIYFQKKIKFNSKGIKI